MFGQAFLVPSGLHEDLEGTKCTHVYRSLSDVIPVQEDVRNPGDDVDGLQASSFENMVA